MLGPAVSRRPEQKLPTNVQLHDPTHSHAWLLEGFQIPTRAHAGAPPPTPSSKRRPTCTKIRGTASYPTPAPKRGLPALARRTATVARSRCSSSPTCVHCPLPAGPGRSSQTLLQGTGKPAEVAEPLEDVFEEIENTNTPPEPTLIRRAVSYSDFYHVVKAQLSKDGTLKRKKKSGRKDRSLEALMLGPAADKASQPETTLASFDAFDDQLLEDSQQEYLYAHMAYVTPDQVNHLQAIPRPARPHGAPPRRAHRRRQCLSEASHVVVQLVPVRRSPNIYVPIKLRGSS